MGLQPAAWTGLDAKCNKLMKMWLHLANQEVPQRVQGRQEQGSRLLSPETWRCVAICVAVLQALVNGKALKVLDSFAFLIHGPDKAR